MIVIKETSDHQSYFEIQSKDAQVLFKSASADTIEKLQPKIKALNPTNNHPQVFERKTNYEGKFLFNLKNGTGELIGSSGLFESEAGMENGIKNFKKRISELEDDISKS